MTTCINDCSPRPPRHALNASARSTPCLECRGFNFTTNTGPCKTPIPVDKSAARCCASYRRLCAEGPQLNTTARKGLRGLPEPGAPLRPGDTGPRRPQGIATVGSTTTQSPLVAKLRGAKAAVEGGCADPVGVYVALRPFLLAYVAWQMDGNGDDAEDALGDHFRKVSERYGLKPDASWLVGAFSFEALNNLVADHFRAQARRQKLGQGLALETAPQADGTDDERAPIGSKQPTPEDEAESNERGAALAGLFGEFRDGARGRLSPTERDILEAFAAACDAEGDVDGEPRKTARQALAELWKVDLTVVSRRIGEFRRRLCAKCGMKYNVKPGKRDASACPDAGGARPEGRAEFGARQFDELLERLVVRYRQRKNTTR